MKLTYFNIQRSCFHDGPGVRTTLFLKGCPLRCVWCHNPEGQSRGAELIFRRDKCVGCGRCAGLCGARTLSDGGISFDRALCTACGKCAAVCLADACELCGKEEEAEKIYEILIRDRLFFRDSDGGITVSGGEPLAQAEGVEYLARRAAEDGIGFAVETSGYGDAASLARLASLGTLFLYDIKGTDCEKHIKNTGVSCAPILDNLRMLASLGADIILRIPLIPGFNDSEEDLDGLCSLISEYREKIRGAQIMPYHKIGLGKARSLGRDTSETENVPDGAAFANAWKSSLERSGVQIKVN